MQVTVDIWAGRLQSVTTLWCFLILCYAACTILYTEVYVLYMFSDINNSILLTFMRYRIEWSPNCTYCLLFKANGFTLQWIIPDPVTHQNQSAISCKKTPSCDYHSYKVTEVAHVWCFYDKDENRRQENRKQNGTSVKMLVFISISHYDCITGPECVFSTFSLLSFFSYFLGAWLPKEEMFLTRLICSSFSSQESVLQHKH